MSAKTWAERRDIAIGATRAQMRNNGLTTKDMTLDRAERTLDELTRANPNLVASHFWLEASDNQYKLFCREWKRWQKEEVQKIEAFGWSE